MLEALRKDRYLVGVINQEVAGHMQHIMNDGYDEQLSIVKLIEPEVPIMLGARPPNYTPNCTENVRLKLLNDAVRKYYTFDIILFASFFPHFGGYGANFVPLLVPLFPQLAQLFFDLNSVFVMQNMRNDSLLAIQLLIFSQLFCLLSHCVNFDR